MFDVQQDNTIRLALAWLFCIRCQILCITLARRCDKCWNQLKDHLSGRFCTWNSLKMHVCSCIFFIEKNSQLIFWCSFLSKPIHKKCHRGKFTLKEIFDAIQKCLKLVPNYTINGGIATGFRTLHAILTEQIIEIILPHFQTAERPYWQQKKIAVHKTVLLNIVKQDSL
jgi:hypothetical protein